MKYILLISISVLFSCNSGSNPNNSVDISIDIWILDNQELKSILSDYIHAVGEYSGRTNSFIQMWYRVVNDSTCSYILSESADINAFIYSTPQVIFQFKGKLICCHIFGLDVFKINDAFLVEFMKKNYPDQYRYYLKVGDYPPPITGGGLEWELIFQNDHLINKKVHYSQ
jgi:hypothetical protein